MNHFYTSRYHEIGLFFEPQCIRVRSDKALDRYMRTIPHAGFRLASFIKKTYLRLNAEPLKISLDSLAIEIYAHYYLQILFLRLNRLSLLSDRRAFQMLSKRILLHTDLIDCADHANDNNRWLWDLIAVLPVRRLNAGFLRLRPHSTRRKD